MSEYFVLTGVKLSTELGTDEAPRLVRVSQFTEGPFQQSYVLTADGGSVLVDPMRPKPREGEQPFLDRIGECQAIVLTTAMHERNVYWFRERLGAPIFCPKASLGELDGSVDHGYVEGEALPGGLQSFWTGDDTRGDAVLLWVSSEGERVLFSGDAINGQTEPGGFEGAVAAFWLQEGGIRLRLPGHVEKAVFEDRFAKLSEVDADFVMTGHNPRPIAPARGAIRKALGEGTFEILENGACSYLWTPL